MDVDRETLTVFDQHLLQSAAAVGGDTPGSVGQHVWDLDDLIRPPSPEEFMSAAQMQRGGIQFALLDRAGKLAKGEKYVYIDRPLTDPFGSGVYCGSGGWKRLNDPDRNKEHQALLKRHGLFRVAVARLPEKQAKTLEQVIIARIALLGTSLNKMPGGEGGPSGYAAVKSRSGETGYVPCEVLDLANGLLVGVRAWERTVKLIDPITGEVRYLSEPSGRPMADGKVGVTHGFKVVQHLGDRRINRLVEIDFEHPDWVHPCVGRTRMVGPDGKVKMLAEGDDWTGFTKPKYGYYWARRIGDPLDREPTKVPKGVKLPGYKACNSGYSRQRNLQTGEIRRRPIDAPHDPNWVSAQAGKVVAKGPNDARFKEYDLDKVPVGSVYPNSGKKIVWDLVQQNHRLIDVDEPMIDCVELNCASIPICSVTGDFRSHPAKQPIPAGWRYASDLGQPEDDLRLQLESIRTWTEKCRLLNERGFTAHHAVEWLGRTVDQIRQDWHGAIGRSSPKNAAKGRRRPVRRV